VSVWLDLRLTAEGVSVMRGGMAVLQGVSFSVGPGQVLVLRGPNGLGKTSLLRMLAGIQPCLAGKLTASPEDLTYAAHADGLKSVLTAKENLQFWAAVHGQTGVEAALAAMDMAHLAGQRAGELSAGQKRRLGLARLLVTGRWLWLLDEPTVSLDTASTARFLAVLRSHLGQGGAAIIATHIDLGLPEARLLDLTEFRAQPSTAPTGGFDEAFT
jgi:heme exporter protein A